MVDRAGALPQPGSSGPLDIPLFQPYWSCREAQTQSMSGLVEVAAETHSEKEALFAVSYETAMIPLS
jgi:hypothetical protein